MARYVVVLWAAATFGGAFPFGTLIVNVGGSFLLGLIMHVSMASDLISPDMRLALTTGVMGGFTTYSTFNYETTEFLRSGSWSYGAINIAATLIACLASGLLGLGAGRLIAGR